MHFADDNLSCFFGTGLWSGYNFFEDFECGVEDDGNSGTRSYNFPSEFNGAGVVLFGWIPGNWQAPGNADCDSCEVNIPEAWHCGFFACFDSDSTFFDPETSAMVQVDLPDWTAHFAQIDADPDASEYSASQALYDVSKTPDPDNSGEYIHKFQLHGHTPQITDNNNRFFKITDPDSGNYTIRDWMNNDPTRSILYGVFAETNWRLLEIADEVIDFSDYDIFDPDDIDGDGETEEPDGVVDFVTIMNFHDQFGSSCRGSLLKILR